MSSFKHGQMYKFMKNRSRGDLGVRVPLTELPNGRSSHQLQLAANG